MPDPAIAQVEDLLKDTLEAWPALSGVTIITEQSADVAIEEDNWPCVVITTAAYGAEQSDEQHQTLHTATVEFEAISGTQTIGTISRANHTIIANVIGAIAQDRTLGGVIQDIQEVDVAPSAPRGKDAGSASLQCIVQFFTSRSDWFTLT